LGRRGSGKYIIIGTYLIGNIAENGRGAREIRSGGSVGAKTGYEKRKGTAYRWIYISLKVVSVGGGGSLKLGG